MILRLPSRLLLACALFLCAWQGRAQATLQTLLTNGPTDRRVNITFFSEGYTAAQLPAFATHANAVLWQMLSTPPFNAYSNCFNAFAISAPSAQSGADHRTPATSLVDTYFNSAFDSYGVQRLLTIPPNDRDGNYANGQGRVDALVASLMPETDIRIMIVNDPDYGGSGGATLLTSLHASSPEIALHELGHSFARLGDEYETPFPGYPDIEEPNTTRSNTRATVKWNAWISAGTPVPTPDAPEHSSAVGAFEGAHYHATGWYRPKQDCKMRTLGISYCEVCAQAAVLSIYDWLRPIDAVTPATNAVTVAGFQQFRVTPVKPAGGSLLCQWFTNGVAISSATNTNFTVTATSLGAGTHTVAVVVSDPTAYVRADPDGLLRDTNTWSVLVPSTSAPFVLTPPASQTVWLGSNAAFSVVASGAGTLAYQWRFQGGALGGETNTTLTRAGVNFSHQGAYDVVITNRFGSITSEVATLTVAVPPVAPAITAHPAGTSVAEGGEVTFTVSATGTAPLTCFWRKDSSVLEVGTRFSFTVTNATSASAGSYSVIVSNAAGIAVSAAAVLAVLPRPPFAGAYHGLFHDSNDLQLASAGFFTAQIRTVGTFKASLQLGRKKLSFDGAFNSAGRASNEIRRAGENPLGVELELDFQGGTVLTGRVTDGVWSSPLRANRAVFNARSSPAADFAGSHTLAIPGADDGAPAPSGDGPGTLRIRPDGTAAISVRLADGSLVRPRGAVAVSGGGEIPIYAPAGKGAVFGWLRLRPDDSKWDGTLNWIRPPGPVPKFYTNGFTLISSVTGSRYLTRTGSLFGLSSARLILTGGGLADALTNGVALAPDGRVTGQGPHQMKLTLTEATGLFQGTLTSVTGGKPLKFRGVILQYFGFGSGFFLGNTESGYVYFGP